jgi:hypothetical protein
MHRSTRMQRLAVAFIVVLLLAVATRFARATPAPAVGLTPESTSLSDAPLAVAGAIDHLDFCTFLLPDGRA